MKLRSWNAIMRKGFLIIGLLVLLQSVFATSYTATQSGNWNAASTWGGSGYPQAGDDATINNTYTITLTADAACTNLTHSNNAVLALGAFNLSVSGNLTFNCNVGTFTASTGYVILNGTSQAISLCGNVTIPNIRLTNNTSVAIGVQNNLNITGNFDCQTGSSTFTDNTNANCSGKLYITGTCTAPNCTFTVANDHVAPGIDFSACTSNPIQVKTVILNQPNSTIIFGNKNVTYITAFSGSNTAGITCSGTVTSAVTASPTLTAAGSATVDASFDVTFADDATWRAAITSITVGGTTLSAGWSKSSGKITFTPSSSNPANLLQSNGSKSIVVIATGYNNATVTQSIGVGSATKLGVKIQPAAPSSNGATLATQPEVYIQDQYGNTTTSTASVVATATSGLWTIGGTSTKAAVSGTSTFTDLTASYATSVSNATITFTSTGLTPVTSGTFNIPSPPSITLASASQISATNIQKNTTKQALSAFTFAITTANASISQLVFTTAGTYSASDISKFQLWYSTSSTLGSAAPIGSDITSSLGTGLHTFSGLSQSISSGSTGYFWITCDVASGATISNTINVATIANSDATFVSGSKSGSATAGGTQTIVQQSITYYSRQSGPWNDANTWSTSCGGSAASVPTQYDNVVLCGWDHTVTLAANTTVANVSMQNRSTITQGSYNLTITGNCDISYSSGQDSKITIGNAALVIGGNLSIGPIAGGTEGLSWDNGTINVTGNFVYSHGWAATSFAGTKAGCFTVNGTSVNIGSDITIPYFKQGSSSFTKTGSATLTVSTTFDRNCVSAPTISAGAFTVSGSTVNTTCGTPNVALASTNPAVPTANLAQGSTKNAIYKFTLAITTNNATLNQVDFSSTNVATNVSKYQLWYKSSDDLSTAVQIGSDITTSLGTGSHSFTGLAQALSVGSTGYFWITTDIAGAASIGNTIVISAISTANITLSSGNKTGSASAGGSQTIAAAGSLSVSTATLTGFYYQGSGPSKAQNFNLSGSNLLNAPGNITVIAPTDYIVSSSLNGSYSSSTTIAYSSSSLSATPVYVKLKSGLTAGTTYAGENITFSGGGYAGSTMVTCTGGVGKVFYLKQSGNWNQTTTWWVDACNGSDAAAVPAQYDSVVCGCGSEWDGKVLTITADATVGGVKIDRLQDFIINNGITFTVNGNLQLGVTGTWADGQGTLNVGNGTLVVNGDMTLGYNNDANGLKWDSGNIYVGGNLICADGGGPSPLDPGSDAANNATLKPGGTTSTYVGAIIMTGANKTINVSAAAVDLVNLKLQSSTISKTGSGILYLTGNLNLNSQTAFDNAAGTLQISGTITNGSSTILSNESVLNIATTTNTVSSISASLASNTVTYFTSGGTEPVPAGTYYNLVISGGGNKVLAGDVTINNALTFDVAYATDYIDLSGHTLTMNNWANGNIANANTSRYVISDNGIFTINGVGSGETANFPLGLSTSSTDFCRVDIANSDAAHTSFSITGICNKLYTNGTCNGAGGGLAITQHAVNLTWFITSLSTNAAVTFYWDQSKELTAFDRTNSGTMHYGSSWEQKSGFGAATNYTGTIWSKSGTFTSFSPGGVDDPTATMLPIELSTFTAKAQAGAVKINWSTLTETNNDYFTLERSIDGQNWEIINSINGAGTSTQNHFYSFVDNNPYGGTNYYRLKQTDLNGDYTYSLIQSVENKNDNLVYTVFPNPSVADEMMLYIKGNCIETISIEIEDMYGRQVCSGSAEISKSPIEIKVSDICLIVPGTYFISIKGANFIQNKKVVIK